MELHCCRVHLRHDPQGNGTPRRYFTNGGRGDDCKVPCRGRGSLCVQPRLDQTEHSAHVLPDFPLPLLQDMGIHHRNLRRPLGYLYHLPLHLHLRPRPEAMVSPDPRAVHQPSWHMGCKRRLNDRNRRCHSNPSNPTSVEAATSNLGKDSRVNRLQLGILVSH